VRDASRVEYQRIIAGMEAQGVGGVILGCTEIAMLIGPDDVALPVFDTTALHAQAAVTWALA
jgi:aspartate racemase